MTSVYKDHTRTSPTRGPNFINLSAWTSIHELCQACWPTLRNACMHDTCSFKVIVMKTDGSLAKICRSQHSNGNPWKCKLCITKPREMHAKYTEILILFTPCMIFMNKILKGMKTGDENKEPVATPLYVQNVWSRHVRIESVPRDWINRWRKTHILYAPWSGTCN